MDQAEHAQKLAEAHAEVVKEYDEVMKSLGDVHMAFEKVTNAAAEDNLHDLLHDLEKAAKAARDGGIIGSGANDHRRALNKFVELRNLGG